jgi:hypothetical protein
MESWFVTGGDGEAEVAAGDEEDKEPVMVQIRMFRWPYLRLTYLVQCVPYTVHHETTMMYLVLQ